MSTLDEFLENHGLTRYQLSKKSGVPQATWKHVGDKPLGHWKVSQVQALAECTGRAASTVLKELERLDNG